MQWAEDAFVQLSESDMDLDEEAKLLDTLATIGAGDTPGFPLSWAVLSDFLNQLGVKIRVAVE